jgi:hypothetical protein
MGRWRWLWFGDSQLYAALKNRSIINLSHFCAPMFNLSSLLQLPRLIMTLAEKIAALTEQEKKEGAAIVAACDALKEALAASEAKIAEIVAQVGDIPQLQAEIANLREQLRLADIAADTISEINAAPIAEPVETVDESEL